jgi:hypothetical protein
MARRRARLPSKSGGRWFWVYLIGVFLGLGALIVVGGTRNATPTPIRVWIIGGVVWGTLAVLVFGIVLLVTRGRDATERRLRDELERYGSPRGLDYVYQPRVVQPAPFLTGCPYSLRGLEGRIAGCDGASLVHHDPLARVGWGVVGQNFDFSGSAAVEAVSAVAGHSVDPGGGQEPLTVLRLPLGAASRAPRNLPQVEGFEIAYDDGVLGLATSGFLTDASDLDRMIGQAEAAVAAL